MKILIIPLLLLNSTIFLGQSIETLKTDSLILTLKSKQNFYFCDTNQVLTEWKKGRMEEISCRHVFYLEDSSIWKIMVEDKNSFYHISDEYYFLSNSLIKAKKKMVRGQNIVWDRQIYYNKGKQILQTGYGRLLMADVVLLDAHSYIEKAKEYKSKK